jgi:hypothetical protein
MGRQAWPRSLVETEPLESMKNMLNNPEVIANLDPDMQKLLLEMVEKRSDI